MTSRRVNLPRGTGEGRGSTFWAWCLDQPCPIREGSDEGEAGAGGSDQPTLAGAGTSDLTQPEGGLR